MHTGPSLACMSGGDLHLILEPPFTSMYYDRCEQLSRVQHCVCEFLIIQFHAWKKPSKNGDQAGFATHSVGLESFPHSSEGRRDGKYRAVAGIWSWQSRICRRQKWTRSSSFLFFSTKSLLLFARHRNCAQIHCYAIKKYLKNTRDMIAPIKLNMMSC